MQWHSQGLEWLGTSPANHVWCPTNPHVYCKVNLAIAISFHIAMHMHLNLVIKIATLHCVIYIATVYAYT